MIYLVYKTINNVNGKIYIGVHQTTDLNDGYKGSGMVLRHAFKKHGKHNFSREILHMCDTADEMYALEEILVDRAFINRDDTYNMTTGGRIGVNKGQCDYIGSDQHIANSDKARDLAIIALREKTEQRKREYEADPVRCKHCGTAIDYTERWQKTFCNQSCSASFNNKGKHRHKPKPVKVKVESEHAIKRREKLASRICIVRSLGIDTSQRGWVSRIAEAIKMHPKDVRKWVEAHVPDIVSPDI